MNSSAKVRRFSLPHNTFCMLFAYHKHGILHKKAYFRLLLQRNNRALHIFLVDGIADIEGIVVYEGLGIVKTQGLVSTLVTSGRQVISLTTAE